MSVKRPLGWTNDPFTQKPCTDKWVIFTVTVTDVCCVRSIGSVQLGTLL